jgi:uncharacterized OsmC-like protein
MRLEALVPHGGPGQGPSPVQAVLGALCGCEAVTFHRTAADLGLSYDFLDFEVRKREKRLGGLASQETRLLGSPIPARPAQSG